MIGMEKGIFFFSPPPPPPPPPSSLIFFFFSICGVSSASGLGWTVSAEFTIVLLLDGPCKSIFLSIVPSSVSSSVFYIGASITKIINRPSMTINFFFLVIFLILLTRFFTIWNHTAITTGEVERELAARVELCYINWSCGNSILDRHKIL